MTESALLVNGIIRQGSEVDWNKRIQAQAWICTPG